MLQNLFTISKFADILRGNYPIAQKDFYAELFGDDMDEGNLANILSGKRSVTQKTAATILNDAGFKKRFANTIGNWYDNGRGWTALDEIAPYMKTQMRLPIPMRNSYCETMKDTYSDLQKDDEPEKIIPYCFLIAVYNDWYINFHMSINKDFITGFKNGTVIFRNKNVLIETSEILQILLSKNNSILRHSLDVCYPGIAAKIFEYCESITNEKIHRGMKFDENKFNNQMKDVEKYADEKFFIYSLFEYSDSNTIEKIISKFSLFAKINDFKSQIINGGSLVI